MSLDGLVIHALTNELQCCLGGRIGKIHQPTENDIVMHIRAQGSNHKLLISANPTYPRVHFTLRSYVNPPEAPMFCMLLRKHFEGGVIEAIEQTGMERILRMQVRQRDELGDISVKMIVIELMGRHSNVILMDPASGTILDGIHHVTPAISSYRVVMPGSAYIAPPEQNKANPLVVSSNQFLSVMRQPNGQSVVQRLVGGFSGLSPLAAQEIAYRGGLAGNEDADQLDDVRMIALERTFSGTMSPLRSNDYRPNIVEVGGSSGSGSGKSYFSVIELTHLQGEATFYESVSDCLEAYYGDKAERDTIKQRVGDLLRFLQNEKNKNVKKLEKLEETIAEAQEADKYRIIGEMLTASMHQLKKGDSTAEIVNYYDEEQSIMKVALDPLLTPSENAQRYFKKYVKSKNSLIAVKEQIAGTHEEIAYLEGLLQQLQSAGLGDIEEIREELTEQGYIRDRSKKMRKLKKKGKPLLSCYTSSEGIPVYVGKNNTQNEYLTNRLAHPGDTWLHTKDIPGSHVVIRSEKYGEATLEEAAQLSAYFSQARDSSLVPVDYTLIRHVRKPNGAKPGFVIYDHQKTLFVTPQQSLVAKLAVETK